MEGVYLNGKHSYSDFGLILEKAEIGPAIPNTYYVDVPFGKRQDITEALYGDVTYSYREIALSLGIKKGHEAWQGFLSRFYNLYNGQKVKLIFDNDASYYYVGRAEFSTPERECRIGKFTMTLNCEPDKY